MNTHNDNHAFHPFFELESDPDLDCHLSGDSRDERRRTARHPALKRQMRRAALVLLERPLSHGADDDADAYATLLEAVREALQAGSLSRRLLDVALEERVTSVLGQARALGVPCWKVKRARKRLRATIRRVAALQRWFEPLSRRGPMLSDASDDDADDGDDGDGDEEVGL